MNEAEFDKFAEDYRSVHAGATRASGEEPEFFFEYKVKDTAALVKEKNYPADLRILDFGAGIGNSLTYFLQYLPSARITCLDVSQKSLEIAAERFSGKAEFTQFDGVSIPCDDGSFSVVFSACVFHHIDHLEHEALLTEIRRVLIPGGLLVIFEHNPFNPLTVRAVATCPLDENAVLIRAHEMQDRLINAGLDEVEVNYRIFFPGLFRVFRPLERFLKRVPFGAQYYVAARKPI